MPGQAPIFYIPRRASQAMAQQPESPMSPVMPGGRAPSYNGQYSPTAHFPQGADPGMFVLDSHERAPGAGGAFPDVPLRPLTLESTGPMGLGGHMGPGTNPRVMIQMQETMAMQQQGPAPTTNEFRIRAFTTMEVRLATCMHAQRVAGGHCCSALRVYERYAQRPHRLAPVTTYACTRKQPGCRAPT